MGKIRTDLLGKTFGQLKVIEDLGLIQKPELQKPRHFWRCLCSCGKEVDYYQDVLVRKSYPVKSCGCLQYRTGAANPCWTGHGEISGNRWDTITRKRKKNWPFKITIEQAWDLFLKQDRRCALSGMELFFGKKGKDKHTATLDRIDSNKGYTSDNVQWIHKDINWMKNSFDQDYFIEICRKVSQWI